MKKVLTFAMTGLILLTVTVIILSTYISSRRVFLKHAREIMQNIASYTIDKTKSHLDPAKDAAVLTSALATNRIVTNQEILKMESYFYEQLFVHSQFSGIFYGNLNGEFVMSSRYVPKENDTHSDAVFFTKTINYLNGERKVQYIYKNSELGIIDQYPEPSDAYDPRERPWYKGAFQNNGPFWTTPYVFFTSGHLGITTANPVYNEGGNIIGVVGVDIEIDEISDFISDLKIGNSGRAFILDVDGQLIAYPDKEKLVSIDTKENTKTLVNIDQLDDIPAQIAFARYLEQINENGMESFEFVNFKNDGQFYHAMFAPFKISDWPWLIGIYLPEDDYIGVLKENRNSIIYFSVIMAVIAMVSAVMVSSSITKPILTLQKKTTDIIERRNVLSPGINTIYSEIRETADHFDLMQRSLSNYRNRMEEIIRKRTRELENSNSDLHEEIENRKFIEKQLIKARNKANEANEAKSAFLANISHEIRTPLNAMIGLTEILSHKYNSKGKDENFQILLRESDRLIELLNRLLDISKIEAGELELEDEVFDLKLAIENVISSFETKIREKGLELNFEFNTDIPAVFIGDELRVSQIFLNLVSNAVKFTEKGRIDITVNVQEGQNEQMIFCSIKDTGIGMSAEESRKIFRQFSQASSGISRKYGGSGLGIPISSQLIELMDGKLEVSSKSAEGTEFFFTLHLPAAIEKIPAGHESGDLLPDLKGTKVLVVEDYAVNRKITLYHLENAGCIVSEKPNGREALEILENNDFDIILMDIQMPILNGTDTVVQIRKMKKRKHIPIVGITANAFISDIKSYLDSGFDDILVKPFRKTTLLETVNYWKGRKSGSQPPKAGDFHNEFSTNVFDKEAFEKEMDNDRETCIELVKGFVESTKQIICEMSGKLDSLEDAYIHRNAHSIKSGAGNIFANHFAQAAARLERSAKQLERNNYKRNLNLMVKRFEILLSALRSGGYRF